MSLPARQYLIQLEQLGEAGQWAYREIIRLTIENTQLKQQLVESQAVQSKLQGQIEELQRQAHRQAAPFRRPENQRSKNPGRPGRKEGHEPAYRPMPGHIDQTLHVPLEGCPHCQGHLQDKRQLTQYIEEIPVVRPHVTKLITEEGWCPQCQQEVYSTHPLQTSRAEGAAKVQLGPRALALATDLSRGKGLSMRKTVAVLQDYFGLKLTPGGLALALQRVGRRLAPEYEKMPLLLQASAVVHVDETGWWVGEPGWYLHVFATAELTYYVVIDSRSREVVLGVLGDQFAGTLVTDCLAIYDDVNSSQQKCYSHHLKAVSVACEVHAQHGEGYLLQIQALLRTSIYLKAFQGAAEAQQFQLCLNQLKGRAQGLLESPRADVQEEKVRLRLWKQRDHLFTFLERAEVPATNNLAERQLRPGVIARKISCGNKTPKGALAWARASSLAATCWQKGESFIELIIRLVCFQPTRGP
jgi:hypothetical protein